MCSHRKTRAEDEGDKTDFLFFFLNKKLESQLGNHKSRAFFLHYYGYENNGKNWIQLSTAPIENRIDYGFDA